MYKKTYLDKVVVRVDFASEILNFDQPMPESLKSKALDKFPIPVARKRVGQELQINPKDKDVKVKDIESRDFLFHDKDKQKTLFVTAQSMFISYKVYRDFDDLKDTFVGMVEALIAAYPELRIRRLGLRYIDKLQFAEADPLKWNDYVNEKMLSIFDIIEDKNKISRALHNLEMNYGDMNIRFQFGMHNPDYPAPIRKKIFLLDTDVYLDGIQTKDDISQNLEKFHQKAKSLFELSITQKLRDILSHG